MAAKKDKKEEFKVSVVEAPPAETKPESTDEIEVNEETVATKAQDAPQEAETVEEVKAEEPTPEAPPKPEDPVAPQKQEEKSEAANDKDTSDEEPKKRTSFWGVFVAFILSLIVGALLIGGIFYFKTSVDENTAVEPTPEATEEPAETESPSPTPEAEPLDLSTYSVQVLNGSGTAGEAGNVSALLEGAGFEDVDAANANRYDYTDTIVQLTEDVEDGVFEAIEEALGEYSVEQGEALEEGSDYEIIITVGSTKNTETNSEE